MPAHNLKLSIAIAGCIAALASSAVAFEGRINALMTRGNETNALLYTVGPNFLRVEMTATNWPNPVDILDLKSGALTLVYPHNRSFVRLKSGTGIPALSPSNGLPVSPDSEATGQVREGLATPIGAGSLSATPSMPAPLGAWPAMRMPTMMSEKLELKATGQTTNLLAFACARYEFKQRGETLEVWATDQLLPYQPYVRNQPSRFGPRMIEEQWPGLLTERKLFPLLVSMHYDNGTERFRFEVKSVKEEKITDPDGKLFQPPPDYHEIEPLPF